MNTRHNHLLHHLREYQYRELYPVFSNLLFHPQTSLVPDIY